MTRILVIATAVSLAALLWLHKPAHSAGRTTFEYTVTAVNNGDHAATLNKLGAQGWELVHVKDHILYLKRER